MPGTSPNRTVCASPPVGRLGLAYSRNVKVTFGQANQPVELEWNKFQAVYNSGVADLLGTWKHPNLNSGNATFNFSGNTFTYSQEAVSSSEYNQEAVNLTGTFVCNEQIIKFTAGDKTRETTFAVTNSGSNLTFADGTGNWDNYWFGTFVKQP